MMEIKTYILTNINQYSYIFNYNFNYKDNLGLKNVVEVNVYSL